MPSVVGIKFHDFVEIARTEIRVIDKTLALREFTREVRWNESDYRLRPRP